MFLCHILDFLADVVEFNSHNKAYVFIQLLYINMTLLFLKQGFHGLWFIMEIYILFKK